MATFYVGWDVGAWHCQKNSKSRDAIVMQNSECKAAKIFYGNAAFAFAEESVSGFFQRLFGEQFRDDDDFIIAVDAALGWPALFRKLICGDFISGEEYTDFLKNYCDGKEKNRLLLRETEIEICDVKKGISPLSAVQDMIGSQSTKVIFFLRKFGFENQGSVWRKAKHEIREIYPSTLQQSLKAKEFVKGIQKEKVCVFYLQQSNPKLYKLTRNWNSDIRDAFYALWAARSFQNWPPLQRKAQSDEIDQEGHIWVQPGF